MVFSNDQAAKVKFVVPDKWKTDSTSCHLEYDSTNALLRVVSDDMPGKVLDIIDPEDLIGASICLESNASSNEEDSTTTPLVVPGRASNEPSSDTLVNRNGVAILTLHCYPKLNPSSKTWSNWCGLTTFQGLPNPKYNKEEAAGRKWPRYKHPRSFILEPTEDLQAANQLLTSLKQLASPKAQTPLRYLVIVSPKSGKHNAEERCDSIAKPMLEEAGIDVDVFVTGHSGHAQERMAKMSNDQDISKYQGIVTMGGDGITYEVLNGIMERDDSEAVRKSVKLGSIGCGTCNGFASSIAHASQEMYGPLTETFLIAKGQSVSIDVSKFEVANAASSYISFLTYAYGIIADIDIESEVVRWLGELRMDVWAVFRVLFLRKYAIKLSYLPAEKVSDKTQPITNMPPLSEPIPDKDWVTIDDNIVLLWVSQVTHAGMHVHLAPGSKTNDGVFKIMLVRGNVSRYRLALILLGVETGGHLGQPKCEFIDACAFRVEPSGNKVGRNVLDGEEVEAGPIQGRVLPGMFQFFCKSISS